MVIYPAGFLPVTLSRDDIGDEDLARLAVQGRVAWDIETTGLDWTTDRISTCQLASTDGLAFLVQVRGAPPRRLLALLANPSVCKVFHHAPFDLRFLTGRWGATPQNVVCTKIASKILDKGEADHSLKALLLRHLGITIDKAERLSNWSADSLTESQIRYATNDVRYLIPLFDTLCRKLEGVGRRDLATQCFQHLPTRAVLEIGGYGDVFAY